MVVLRSLIAVILLLPLLYNLVNTQQDLVSPCPRVFVYESKSPEPGKWYGILTLLSDYNNQGVFLRVILDRSSLDLGTSFGQVKHIGKEYLISNSNFQLKANTPQTVRFFVKYDTSQPPPKLVGFRLNGGTVCPKWGDMKFTFPHRNSTSPHMNSTTPHMNSTSPLMKLQTNGTLEGSTPVPRESEGVESINIRPGSIINLGSAFRDSEDFFSTANHPQQDVDDTEVNEKCGTVTIDGSAPVPLITNGQDTSEGEYPWHAALYQTKGVNLEYLCGASLITKSHIITAAHCVTKWKTSIPRNIDSLVIYLGRYNLHRFNEGTQERLVANIIPHHQYNPQRLHNDIAIVKFTMPIKITDHVRPVCLWQDSIELSAVIDKQGSVVGWGIDESGKLSEKLKQAKMPVVAQETCLRSVPEFFPLFTSNRTFCAGFRNGTSVCNGDSGDGMVFPTANSNANKVIWQLRGIVSLSVDLKMTFKCDPSHYVVFTDAAKHLDWIKQVLRQ